ncbi:hypothetical protein BGX28_004233 [Mortierella sp. GBA30]|nr:hypothetical protein BGX28_004233 [Mortierella sp. GBA30]
MPRVTPVLFTFPFPSQDQQYLPNSVQVTGTFDDWQRTTGLLTKNDQNRRFEAEIQVDLERLQEIFERPQQQPEQITTELGVQEEYHPPSEPENQQEQQQEQREEPKAKRKLVYKFILDGSDWVTDPTQALERDYEGNLNNVRFLEDRTVAEKEEDERQAAERTIKESEDDDTIQKLGGGMWGTPNFAVNDPIQQNSMENIPKGDSGIHDGGTTTKPLVDHPSTIGTEAVNTGDKRPAQDGSVAVPLVAPLSKDSTKTTGDEHEGDGDYGVAFVQGDPVIICSPPLLPQDTTNQQRPTVPVSDANPTVDASAAVPTATTAPLTVSTSSHHVSEPSPNTATTMNTAPGTMASASMPSLVSSISSNPASVTQPSPNRSTLKLYGDDANKDNVTIKSAVPTTAVSTTAPQLPSSNSLAEQVGGNKPGEKKRSFWKKLKKAFS